MKGVGICPVCRGAGNILTFARGIEYWPCSGCHGAGVTFLHNPPTFRQARGKARSAS